MESLSYEATVLVKRSQEGGKGITRCGGNKGHPIPPSLEEISAPKDLRAVRGGLGFLLLYAALY